MHKAEIAHNSRKWSWRSKVALRGGLQRTEVSCTSLSVMVTKNVPEGRRKRGHCRDGESNREWWRERQRGRVGFRNERAREAAPGLSRIFLAPGSVPAKSANAGEREISRNGEIRRETERFQQFCELHPPIFQTISCFKQAQQSPSVEPIAKKTRFYTQKQAS